MAKTAGKKFDFANPADSFIDDGTTDTSKKAGRPKSDGETRSKRTNVLFKPSTFNDLQELAALQSTSMNSIINDLVIQYIAANQDNLDKYRQLKAQLSKH